jgi:hypothetical protein
MDSEGQRFDVFWSERSIRQFGLKSATKVGEGITGLGSGGYNQCLWSGSLPLHPLPHVYFAIQQQGEKRFRQVKMEV